ncbi:conjugal transfer protein TraI [Azospirillum brasilense]|uniref:Acyl-homoserine-lactone synthase n=2 Tax=Azospirillum brasilense TaxID=192 RepID=A0A6L3AUF6_AZOBR|nr:conjugal transfer protein TraI [Azospirillum brasilense]
MSLGRSPLWMALMNHQISFLKQSNQIPPDLLRRLFEFRHEVFVQRLGWVPARGAEEVDYFDTLGPHYAVCQDQDGQVIAGARLLPMAGPSMLRDVFPALLGDRPCPQDEGTWEISRFALRPTRGDRTAHRRALLSLVGRMLDFAVDRGIHRLVAVSDTRLERLVADATGLPIHRLSSPQRIGTDWAVAGWTDVSTAARAALADRLRRDRARDDARTAA